MSGRGPFPFGARVAALLERPDLWRAFPGGVAWDARHYRDEWAIRQLWIAVVAFLQGRGLVSPVTLPIDVNVPRLVAACRREVGTP